MTEQTPETNLAARQHELATLLAAHPDWEPLRICEEMQISKAWFYQLRDRLIALGVFYPVDTIGSNREFIYPMDSTTSPNPAPVRYTWWDDDEGMWSVQALMLHRWDRKPWPRHLPDRRVVVVRFARVGTEYAREWAWTASRRERWTTDQTRKSLPVKLTRTTLERVTREVAWALGVDAVIPPEE